jgi:hypothetical protein
MSTPNNSRLNYSRLKQRHHFFKISLPLNWITVNFRIFTSHQIFVGPLICGVKVERKRIVANELMTFTLECCVTKLSDF